ncbi:uncharacterized protein LOC131879455 isoform X3 [Tigriopus californicus]|uniref:uncharacterized protein LOC131879455 isoform X3 n=1 Tax=Tigriopus californicus TaxID=6832 RepID=UPI0027DAB167|nr:uncharacterized protein LOC131879455 isoform X3 [Tigriopus californicus]
MKFWIACVVLGLAAQQAFAEELFDDSQLAENEARFLFMNTSGTAAGLTLLGALILLGVIAYLIYAGGILGGSTGYNRNGFEQYNNDQYANYEQQYAQYRSSNDGFEFNSLNIIQWISMLQDLYERFDYNDLECQKRLICEVMREPDYYGAAAEKFKAGFQYAKYLEVLSLPDDMRELLDEYLDANSRADQNKECEEFFQCPYSIKDSFKRNISGNSL